MLKILFFLCLFCPKTCIPARPPPRFAAQLSPLCGRTVPVYALPPRKAPGTGCSHPTSNFTTPCKKKTASAFLHADGFWRRWWVLPRPKNSPLGCFCPAGRKAPGTGCSHPTSNFTTLCKKKTASAFLHADGSGGDGGFSRALKTAHWAVFARRDAKRRARAVLIPPATSLHCAKRKPPALFFTLTALAEMVGFEPTCPVKDKTISSL